MFFQSLTWRLLLKCYRSIKSAVNASFFVKLYASLCEWVSRQVQTSRAYSWIDSNVLTDEMFETSWFYQIAYRIKKKMQVWLTDLLGWCRASIFCRYGRCMAARLPIDVLLAFFLGGMLVVPHEMWHNGYFIVAIMLFLCLVLASGAFHGAFTKRELFLLFVALFVFGLSAVLATEPMDALRFFTFFLASVVLLLCVAAVLNTEEKLMRFVNVILLFVGITGFLGIMQRLTGVAVNPEFVDVQVNQTLPGRVFSTFANPNNFAQLLVLFMPFFISAIAYSDYAIEKVLLSASFIASFISLVMTYSRSAWLGAFGAIVIFVCLFDKRKLLLLLLLFLAVIPFLPQTVLARILTIGSLEDSSNAYRIHIWRGCFIMLKEVGLVGVGLGSASFKAVYPAYASRVAAVVPHSHMLFLQIALETGLSGLTAFLACVAGVLAQTASHMRRMSRKLRCCAAAGAASLCGAFIISFFEYIWFYPRIMFAFWLVLGILTALVHVTKRK